MKDLGPVLRYRLSGRLRRQLGLSAMMAVEADQSRVYRVPRRRMLKVGDGAVRVLLRAASDLFA